jgi:hypothetical protein
MSHWRALLSGEDAEQALASVESIAASLCVLEREPSVTALPPSIALGDAGIALFFSELERSRLAPHWDGYATRYLERALGAIVERQVDSSLLDGFAGVGWVESFVSSGEFSARSQADPRCASFSSTAEQDDSDDIREAILLRLRDRSAPSSFDFMSGAAGFAEFGLRRLDAGDFTGRAIVEEAIRWLDASAERSPKGIAWRLPSELVRDQHKKLFHERAYALGVSHGITGVISVLARAIMHDVDADRSVSLLDGSLCFLLAHENEGPKGRVYPASTSLLEKDDLAGLTWCWGDLGISAVLSGAGKALGHPDLEASGMRAGRRAAERALRAGEAREASLCHGIAGAAHLLNRLFQLSGEEIFQEAARRWYVRLLEARQPDLAFGGYEFLLPPRAWPASSEVVFGPAPNFLMGSAGVGLALLSAVGASPPRWDRALALGFERTVRCVTDGMDDID